MENQAILKKNSLDGSKKRCTGHTLCSNGRGKYGRDEVGNLNFHIVPKSLKVYYGQFCNSRPGRLREEALSYLVEALSINVENKFVEEKFVTFLHHLLNCVKKGCAKERLLASHVVGLLAITVSSHEYAHTVYEDSLSVLSPALDRDPGGLKMLECVGIVTFFGSENSEETQIAMQTIWKLVFPANPIISKPVLAAAITAWSFLLSTVDGWRLNHKYWRRAVSHLSNLLHDDEKLVRVAAGEALALILETESIEKFSGETRISLNEFKHEVKENIVNKLNEVGDEHSAEILSYLEDGYGDLGAPVIGEDGLVLSSLSQRVQLNFLKNFLGESGFSKHMMENEHLCDVFELTTMADDSSSWDDAYADCKPIREEIVVHFYRHEAVRREEDGSMLTFVGREEKQLLKRMTKSPNSFLSKARTKVLNKKRFVKKGNELNPLS